MYQPMTNDIVQDTKNPFRYCVLGSMQNGALDHPLTHIPAHEDVCLCRHVDTGKVAGWIPARNLELLVPAAAVTR